MPTKANKNTKSNLKNSSEITTAATATSTANTVGVSTTQTKSTAEGTATKLTSAIATETARIVGEEDSLGDFNDLLDKDYTIKTKEQEEEQTRKLKYIFEVCKIRLNLKENLKQHFTETTDQEELQHFWMQQYNSILKDKSVVKKRVLGIIDDHIKAYKEALNILNTYAKNEAIFKLALLFKSIAFAQPQFEQIKISKNNMAPTSSYRSDSENYILRNLYQIAFSLLDKNYQKVIGSVKNTIRQNTPCLELTNSPSDIIENFLNHLTVISIKIENFMRSNPKLSSRFTQKLICSFCECDLRFVADSLTLKKAKTREEFLIKRVGFIRHASSDQSILSQTRRILKMLFEKISPDKNKNNVDFIGSILFEWADYFAVTKIKLSRAYGILSHFADRITKHEKQQKCFEEAKINITKRMLFLDGLFQQKKSTRDETNLEHIKKLKEEMKIYIHTLEKERENQLLIFSNLELTDEKQFNNDVQKYARAIDEPIQYFFDFFEQSTQALLEYEQQFKSIYKQILEEVREASKTPVEARNLQTQVDSTVTAAAPIVEKQKRPSKDKVAETQRIDWKKLVEEQRVERDKKRKEKHEAIIAEAKEEARDKQALLKSIFELSIQELERREKIILSNLSITPTIKNLFTKLYENPCNFCCNDLLQLVNALKEQGYSVGIETPSGGSSHFTVYIFTQEYTEKGGAFFMKDSKAKYPSHIIKGLREIFTRSGFSDRLISTLDKTKQSPNTLQIYGLHKQTQPQAVTAAASAASVEISTPDQTINHLKTK